MKTFLTFLSVFICITSCVSTQPTGIACASCRTGHFYSIMYNTSGLGHWKEITTYIERNDTLEISTRQYPIQDTGYSRITWLSDCKYNVVPIRPVTHYDSLYQKFRPNGITYTITKVTADYIVTAYKGIKDTLWRVK